MFQGSYEALLLSGTRTGNAMKHIESLKEMPRMPKEFLSVQNASVHNLKNVSVNIPLNVLTVVTGVAGSGKSSLEKAKELGCGAVCFEGNIDFYGKSGLTYASEFGIRYHGLPEGEDASFFLFKELIPGYLDGITGEYATPKGYFVDEAEVETFDKEFPMKEKLKLPGQIF